MKKVLIAFVLLFVLLLGLEMGNDIKNDNDSIASQIEKFEEKIENGEEIITSEDKYIIEGGVINDIAKKSESIIKSLMEKLREYI